MPIMRKVNLINVHFWTYLYRIGGRKVQSLQGKTRASFSTGARERSCL